MNKERVAWASVVMMLMVLLFWSVLAYDALAQHMVALGYAHQQCLEIQVGEAE